MEAVTDGAGWAVTYSTARHGANFQIKIGDADRIVTGRAAYRITYLVRGALDAYADHDELYWNVNGDEAPVPTGAVGATVTFARGGLERAACFQGTRGSSEACRLSATGGTAVTYESTRALAPGEQLTIVAGIRKGLLPEPTPLIRPRARDVEDWFALDGWRGGLAALTLMGALALVARLWWRRGRDDPGVRADVLVTEYEPPDRLRPAHLGLLLDERADPKDLTATIVDLAVRGHLVIEETERRGLFAAKDWTLASTGADRGNLEPYESTLLAGLFEDGPSVKLSTLRGTFAGTLDAAQSQLYKSAVSRGWFPADPRRVRGLWALGGAGLAILGVGLAVVLGMAAGAALVGLAVVGGGVALLALSPSMSRRTSAGRELARRTLGFKRYMEVAEADRQRFAERVSLFTEYLPYAIVFGCVQQWARAFAGLATAATTATWYHGASALDAAALSSSLQGFSSNISSAIVSRPGGSGFSGGSAGGGGGGGGTGSW